MDSLNPSYKVYSLDWTPEKNRIVSASQDGRLIVWNALTSQKTHAIKLPCAWVMTCAFSPSGQSVACGGLDSVCSIFNLSTPLDKDGNLPVSRMLSGHKGYVSCCQYVPDDDTRLITGSGDQTCVLWDITTGLRSSVFGGEFQSGHTADVLSVSINGSDSRMFVSGSCDKTARLWDTRVASRAVRTFHGHEGDVNSVKFFPDGNRFGTGSEDGTCRLFDIRTGHQLQVYPPQQGDSDTPSPSVTSIAFSISGRLLFASYSNGDCFVWDTLLAEVVLNLGTLQNSHDARVSCLGLSADGSALCTGSWDSSLKDSDLNIQECPVIIGNRLLWVASFLTSVSATLDAYRVFPYLCGFTVLPAMQLLVNVDFIRLSLPLNTIFL
ncbi:guanine nucleotide-binding protein subunit beta-2 [Tanacetum coccineum]